MSRSFLLFSFFSPYFNKSNHGLPKMASATVNADTQVRTSRSSVGTITGSTNDLVRLQQGVPAWITFTSLYHSRYIRKHVRESYLLTIRSIFVSRWFVVFYFLSPFRLVYIAWNIYIELYAYVWTYTRMLFFYNRLTSPRSYVERKFVFMLLLTETGRCQTS